MEQNTTTMLAPYSIAYPDGDIDAGSSVQARKKILQDGSVKVYVTQGHRTVVLSFDSNSDMIDSGWDL